MKIGDVLEFECEDGSIAKGTITWMETDPAKEFKVRVSFPGVETQFSGWVCSEGRNE